MSGYSSGGEDEWMQIQGFIRATPVSKEEFDLRPFFFNHPMVLPYAPMELCSYCGKDGLVRCSRCRDWYCGESCQKNHWPKHKLDCRPPPHLEKRDGYVGLLYWRFFQFLTFFLFQISLQSSKSIPETTRNG